MLALRPWTRNGPPVVLGLSKRCPHTCLCNHSGCAMTGLSASGFRLPMQKCVPNNCGLILQRVARVSAMGMTRLLFQSTATCQCGGHALSCGHWCFVLLRFRHGWNSYVAQNKPRKLAAWCMAPMGEPPVCGGSAESCGRYLTRCVTELVQHVRSRRLWRSAWRRLGDTEQRKYTALATQSRSQDFRTCSYMLRGCN